MKVTCAELPIRVGYVRLTDSSPYALWLFSRLRKVAFQISMGLLQLFHHRLLHQS